MTLLDIITVTIESHEIHDKRLGGNEFTQKIWYVIFKHQMITFKWSRVQTTRVDDSNWYAMVCVFVDLRGHLVDWKSVQL